MSNTLYAGSRPNWSPPPKANLDSVSDAGATQQNSWCARSEVRVRPAPGPELARRIDCARLGREVDGCHRSVVTRRMEILRRW